MPKKAAERTSYEVRRRWDTANLKKYVVAFRYDTDAKIIEYIERNKAEQGTTKIFRTAMNKYINGE